MRYTFENNIPVKITNVVVEGKRIVNPSDKFIDKNGLGYELVPCEKITTDDSSKKVVHGYELEDGKIKEKWIVEDKSKEELIQDKKEEIERINRELSQFGDTPITFTNGKQYLPRWLKDYYVPVRQLGNTIFPREIVAVDGSVDEMTWEQFKELYRFLYDSADNYQKNINAQLMDLNTEIAELEAE